MATPLVAYDDWSPSFDALIEYQLLDRLGLITPNPTAADAERSILVTGLGCSMAIIPIPNLVTRLLKEKTHCK